MYKNPGRSIKSLTKIIVVIGMVVSVVGGLSIMGVGSVIVGLLVAILGCLLSWVSGLTLAAYGDIADNLQAIRNKIAGEEKEVDYIVEAGKKVMTEEELLAEGVWECISCKTKNPLKRQYCIKCGTNRDWSEEKSKK